MQFDHKPPINAKCFVEMRRFLLTSARPPLGCRPARSAAAGNAEASPARGQPAQAAAAHHGLRCLRSGLGASAVSGWENPAKPGRSRRSQVSQVPGHLRCGDCRGSAHPELTPSILAMGKQVCAGRWLDHFICGEKKLKKKKTKPQTHWCMK